MFTGIVEEIGRVTSREETPAGVRLEVGAGAVLVGLRRGDSVAVNGVCLTAVDRRGHTLGLEVVPETLRRTNLGSLIPDDRVNLERAARLGDRLDGHLVQGHVDGTGRVEEFISEDGSRRLRIGLEARLAGYLVEKGSVAVDGVSLTVAAVGAGWFEVALIPHTLRATTLGLRSVGDVLNLEVDVLAKYVERLLGRR
ncbi:MAG: riboflavin synthase [Acidimicrobiia bacterium]